MTEVAGLALSGIQTIFAAFGLGNGVEKAILHTLQDISATLTQILGVDQQILAYQMQIFALVATLVVTTLETTAPYSIAVAALKARNAQWASDYKAGRLMPGLPTYQSTIDLILNGDGQFSGSETLIETIQTSLQDGPGSTLAQIRAVYEQNSQGTNYASNTMVQTDMYNKYLEGLQVQLRASVTLLWAVSTENSVTLFNTYTTFINNILYCQAPYVQDAIGSAFVPMPTPPQSFFGATYYFGSSSGWAQTSGGVLSFAAYGKVFLLAKYDGSTQFSMTSMAVSAPFANNAWTFEPLSNQGSWVTENGFSSSLAPQDWRIYPSNWGYELNTYFDCPTVSVLVTAAGVPNVYYLTPNGVQRNYFTYDNNVASWQTVTYGWFNDHWNTPYAYALRHLYCNGNNYHFGLSGLTGVQSTVVCDTNDDNCIIWTDQSIPLPWDNNWDEFNHHMQIICFGDSPMMITLSDTGINYYQWASFQSEQPTWQLWRDIWSASYLSTDPTAINTISSWTDGNDVYTGVMDGSRVYSTYSYSLGYDVISESQMVPSAFYTYFGSLRVYTAGSATYRSVRVGGGMRHWQWLAPTPETDAAWVPLFESSDLSGSPEYDIPEWTDQGQFSTIWYYLGSFDIFKMIANLGAGVAPYPLPDGTQGYLPFIYSPQINTVQTAMGAPFLAFEQLPNTNAENCFFKK